MKTKLANKMRAMEQGLHRALAGNSVFWKLWYRVHTAVFVGLYTATGSAEFSLLLLGGPCGPSKTL